MEEYLKILRHVLENGTEKDDRTGTGTISCFGYQARYDLQEGFPLLTTKKVFLRSILHELLWFLDGDTNIKYLVDNDVGIWNEWPYQKYLEENDLEDDYPRYSDEWKEKKDWFVQKIKDDDDFAEKWGDLGPVYGKQWRNWEGADGQTVDQIKNAVEMLKNKPDSRRIIISGWNAGDIQKLVEDPNGAPPPCHTLFQFYVADGKLSCQLYQRSADLFLGVPFNIASYSLLTMMMAQVTGYEPGEFVHTFGDVHIYKNHLDQVEEQLSRETKELPTMKINPDVEEIDGFEFDDFELEGYDPEPYIKAPISL